MKTETYNGIDIFFNSTSRLYFTKDFIYSRANNRTKGTVMSTRVERVKEEIDIFVKRCVAIKNKTFVFIRKRYDKGYVKAQVLIFDKVSNCVTVLENKKVRTYPLSDYRFNCDKVFFDSRKNKTLIDEVFLCNAEIIKQKKLISENQAKMVAVRSNNNL